MTKEVELNEVLEALSEDVILLNEIGDPESARRLLASIHRINPNFVSRTVFLKCAPLTEIAGREPKPIGGEPKFPYA